MSDMAGRVRAPWLERRFRFADNGTTLGRDTMGTLVGVGKTAGYLNETGELPEIRKPLLVDSLAAIAGGVASTSSADDHGPDRGRGRGEGPRRAQARGH